MKKFFAGMLCLGLLLAVLPLGVFARKTDDAVLTPVEQTKQDARRSYYRSRGTAGKTSFHGTCGLMVSHQLYNLGINTWRIVFDGNDQFDYYRDLQKTTGGYYIKAYGAEDYSLEQALMAVTNNGTRVVRNILVGFQWTNTAAGAIYGHTVLINGIIDGVVYFVESFHCPLGGPEGTVIDCTIEEFAKYYDKWTSFEGLIHFGSGRYYQVCPSTATDLTVQARFSTTLRSEPAVIGQRDCVRLRNVAAGERLRAVAIYHDDHTQYYCVQTNEGVGYIAAGAVSLLQVNAEGVGISEFGLSRRIKWGQQPVFQGTATDDSGQIVSIEVCITDENGQLVRREVQEAENGQVQLAALRDALCFDLLEQGVYQIDVYAARGCSAVVGSATGMYYTRVPLCSRTLQVGGNPRDALQSNVPAEESRDGWFLKNGTWYCYMGGKPVTGWTTHLGVRYYLDADGAATTGIQEIDGKQRYFSATGALVTGWLTLDGSTSYRSPEGVALTGWQTIGAELYYFGEDGTLRTDTELMRDGNTYLLGKDGAATLKPNNPEQVSG